MSKCDFPACQMTRSNCSISCVLSKRTVPEAEYRDAGPSERSVYDRTGLPPVAVRADLAQAPAPVRVKPDLDAIESGGKRWHGEDHRVVSVRWEPYKPDGARQMKAKGRWQEQVGSGDYWRWQNCERPQFLAVLEPDAAPDWLTNCAVCGRIVDTREKAEGGDGHGCEYPNGWTCSSDCAGKLNPDPDWMQEGHAALAASDAGVVAELVEALWPLWAIYKDRSADVPEWKDSDTVVAYVSIGSLRRAASALAKLETRA